MSQRQNFPISEPIAPRVIWEALGSLALAVMAAAVLFPLYASRPDGCRSASCSSGLKQLGIAIMMYSQDYDDRLPSLWRGPAGNGQCGGWLGYRAWPNAGADDLLPSCGTIEPYVRCAQVFVCPQDASGRRNSYSLNGGLMVDGARGGGYHQGRSLGELTAAANTVMLVEERHPLVPGPADGCALAGCGIAFRRHGDRRTEGTNVAFADGHVKLYVPATMRAHDELPLWRWGQVSGPAGEKATR